MFLPARLLQQAQRAVRPTGDKGGKGLRHFSMKARWRGRRGAHSLVPASPRCVGRYHAEAHGRTPVVPNRCARKWRARGGRPTTRWPMSWWETRERPHSPFPHADGRL